MKTALEQLIDEMESLQDKPYINPMNALSDCIHLAYAKLPTEKQQIIDAFNNGYKNGKIDIEDGTLFNDGNDYYTETFKDK